MAKPEPIEAGFFVGLDLVPLWCGIGGWLVHGEAVPQPPGCLKFECHSGLPHPAGLAAAGSISKTLRLSHSVLSLSAAGSISKT